MASQLAWLDHSAAEQKRVRELLRLFSETDTRDELGTGQVRDAFSDLLFPGMSVLLTRARYLVFIPWSYPDRHRGTAAAAVHDGDRRERQTILTLQQHDDRDGLIGARAGARVKNLPSALYSTALRVYGIQLHELGDRPDLLTNLADETELTERRAGSWHRSVPPAPAGFPRTIDGGFDLTSAEAEFIRNRIAAGSTGRYLHHLVTGPPDQLVGDAPWSDPASATATPEVRRDLQFAEDFALINRGAALLYNLLVAEAYERSNLTTVVDPVDHYRTALDEWADAIDSYRDPATWEEIRVHTCQINPRIAQNHRLDYYLRSWFSIAVGPRRRHVGIDRGARELIAARERHVKRQQSRLENRQLLASWQGSSGAAGYVYRWGSVRSMINDVLDGLSKADDAAA